MLKRPDADWSVTKNNQLEKTEFVKKQIGDILLSFENEPKRRESFSRLVDDLLKIKYADSESSEIFDRSFSQEEINQLLLNVLDDFDFKDSKKDKEIIFKLFNNVFSAERKTAEENNTVSDLSAEGLINLIREGKVLDGAFVYGLEAWLQNLQMVNPKDRIKLVSFFLNNPGQVSSALIPNLIGAQGIFGENLVSDLEQEFERGKNQAEKMMAILDVLFVLEKMSGGPFDDAAKKAGEILEKIKTTCDNYFVQERISIHEEAQAGKFTKRYQEFFHKYDEENLRTLAPEPLENNFYKSKSRKEEMIAGSSFSQICDKYGVIYNPFGEIDSFFSLDGEKKNLRVEEILKREGFANFKNLGQDEQDVLVNNYLSLAHVYFREKIEKDFGIKLQDFSFREQLQFLDFISTKNKEEVERVKNYLDSSENSDSKRNRIKSFLSLEQGRENGENILNIGEKLKSEEADKIFARVASLVDLAQQKTDEIKNQIVSEDFEIDFREVQNALLKKTHEIISQFSVELENKKNDDQKIQELLKKLERGSEEIDLLSVFLKTAKAQGQKINLKILKNINLSKKEIGVDLVREEKEDVLDMTRENYARIFHENREAGKSVVDNLEKELFAEDGIKDQLAYTLKIEDKVIAFCKAKRLESGAMYLGSLNVHPDAKNYSLGILFLEKVISELSEKYDIQAITRADNPANKSYKKLGFQFGKTFEKNGEKYFEIFLARKSEDKKVENS